MSPPSKKKQTSVEKPVLYDQIRVKMCIGEKALTAAQAKKLLGWEAESEKNKFGPDYLLKDENGVKIRCNHNMRNRPYTPGNMESYKQEILRGNWYFNGESRIISATGQLISAQHTLIALVMAVQEWTKHPDSYPRWETEPTMETSIMLGVSDEDKVVNTVDTGKPRTLGEVIYRSPFFAEVAPKDRQRLSRICEYAVRQVWYRTGVGYAYAPGLRKTHAEFLAFIEHHPRLLECVKHIFVEDGGERQISKYLSPGSASGLLYLMASSHTDPTEYRRADFPDEQFLDWTNWQKACDFFVLIAGASPEIEALTEVLQKTIDSDQGSSAAERVALIVKSWECYIAGEPITPAALRLDYETDDEGWKTLAECPAVGGIDYGDPTDAGDPTLEEIEQQKAEVRTEREAKKIAAKKKTKKTQVSDEKPSAKSPAKRSTRPSNEVVGKVMWVCEEDGDHWRGKVVEVEGKNARLKILQGFQGAGNIRVTTVQQLRRKQPH